MALPASASSKTPASEQRFCSLMRLRSIDDTQFVICNTADKVYDVSRTPLGGIRIGILMRSSALSIVQNACNPGVIACIAALLLAAPSALPGQTNSQDSAPQQHSVPSDPAIRQPGIPRNTLTAPPLSVAEKFRYRIVDEFSVRGAVGNLVGAAIGQATNTPAEWGQGWGAYGERYASGFGSTLSRQMFAFTLESALHEDPRYFPSTETTTGARLKNALKYVLVTHTDAGGDSFAYARVISAFGTGQLVNVWQPRSNNRVSDGIERTFIILGVDTAYNLAQEFIPFFRPKPFRRHP